MKKSTKKNKIFFGQDPNDKKFEHKNKIKRTGNSFNCDTHNIAPSFSKEGIYKIFKNTPHPLRLDDILRRLEVSRRSKKELLFLLQELIDEKKIVRQRGANYALIKSLSSITGRLSIQRSGAGFVTPQVKNDQKSENKILNQKDIYIPPHALLDAWNGDLVEVLLLPSSKPNFSSSIGVKKSSKQEGQISKILERAQTQMPLCIESEAKKQHYTYFKNTKNLITQAFIARPTDSRYAFRVLLPLPQPEEFENWQAEAKKHAEASKQNLDSAISIEVTNKNTKEVQSKKTSKSPYFLHEGDLVIASFNNDFQNNFQETFHDKRTETTTQSIVKPIANELYLGKVVKKLGSADKVSVQEEVAKHNHNIPTHFPDDVLLEAKEIAQTHGFFYTKEDEEEFKVPLLHKDAKSREAKHNTNIGIQLDKEDYDLRSLTLVTIDGADSKDFDDAIFVEKQENSYRLLVAIADVSRYVLPFSKIDLEAKARANSYYFPSSVEPMIPPILSNGLCSLRPHEDHKVMFADMLFDAKGTCIKSDFGQGVMQSKARLTYEGVQSFYDTHTSSLHENRTKVIDNALLDSTENKDNLKNSNANTLEYDKSIPQNVQNMLLEAKELAQILIKKRHKQGALNLEIPEPKCVTKNNEIVSLSTRPHLFAHTLIEAFMVKANEQVAEYLHKQKAPCLYRVHPAPAPERLESLNLALQSTASVNFLPSLSPQQMGLNAWLSSLLNTEQQMQDADQREGTNYLTHQLILRAMMQARYSPYLEEHFGLASDCYCHFTSPIRRYSDLMVHRSLKQCLGIKQQNKNALDKILVEDSLINIADKCNEQERVAQNAEREIFRRLACVLLESEVEREFEAIISGVTAFGLFAQMKENMAEGMIRMENLKSDYFIYEEETQSLFGQKTKITYRLGDTIKVILQSVDLSRLEINLILPEDNKNSSKRPIKTDIIFKKTHSQHQPSFRTRKSNTPTAKKLSSKKSKKSQNKSENIKLDNKSPHTSQKEVATVKPRFPKKPKQKKEQKNKKKDHKKTYQDDLY